MTTTSSIVPPESTSSSSGGGASLNSPFTLTGTDSNLPNSVVWADGVNTEVDLSSSGLIKINVYDNYLKTIGSGVTVDLTNTSALIQSADASSNNMTYSLPASPKVGREFNFKKIDNSANTVTIDGNGNTLDGQSTIVLTTQFDGLIIKYGDSGDWHVF